MPALVFFFSMFLAFSLLYVIEAGVILSFFVAIIGLNLIFVGDAFEVYESSKVFIENLRRGNVKLGVVTWGLCVWSMCICPSWLSII